MRSRSMSCAVFCAWLLPVVFCTTTSTSGELERGVAITDPGALRELDGTGLGLGRMLGEAADSRIGVFALPSMVPIRTAIDRDFDRYRERHKVALAGGQDEAGKPATLQLFDLPALYADSTRFVLAGIVNRMDRAYVDPGACGEIRLIYRPVAHARPEASQGKTDLLRLPMTLNLVMKAKGASSANAMSGSTSCGDIAGKWLASGTWTIGGADLAAKLMSADGPLSLVTPQGIDRIETDIQMSHAPANVRDFEGRADYLMKVFRYDPLQRRFDEAPLENQIDRARMAADASLAADFKQWLLQPEHIAEFDRGTIVLPDRFLAMSAVNETPTHPDVESNARDLFTDDDIVTALARASAGANPAGAPLQNILTPEGFARRLDDITCAGCHRSRAIGGFHFPGVDWLSAATSSAVVTPASPHFFGDQERRRDILASLRDGRPPDFSRGFSARPQPSRSKELLGTTFVNGWGAVCYTAGTHAAPVDKSFASWTCAEGLTCQASVAGANSSRTGFCFIRSE